MNTTDPKHFSISRIASALYLIVAIASFGPIAVDFHNSTPPGPNLQERQGYGVMLALFVAPVWPLYWSYKIAG